VLRRYCCALLACRPKSCGTHRWRLSTTVPLTGAVVPLSGCTRLAAIGAGLVDGPGGEHPAVRVARHARRAVDGPRGTARGTRGAHARREAIRGVEVLGIAPNARTSGGVREPADDQDEQVGRPAPAPTETWVARRITVSRRDKVGLPAHDVHRNVASSQNPPATRPLHRRLAHPLPCSLASKERGRASERHSAAK
jgi:hypothetical protein